MLCYGQTICFLSKLTNLVQCRGRSRRRARNFRLLRAAVEALNWEKLPGACAPVYMTPPLRGWGVNGGAGRLGQLNRKRWFGANVGKGREFRVESRGSRGVAEGGEPCAEQAADQVNFRRRKPAMWAQGDQGERRRFGDRIRDVVDAVHVGAYSAESDRRETGPWT